MANFDPAFEKMIRNEGGFKLTHIGGVGKIADDLITTDKERLTLAIEEKKIEAGLIQSQVEVNMVVHDAEKTTCVSGRDFPTTGVADGQKKNPTHIRAQRAPCAPLQVSHLRDRGSGRVHGFRSTTQSEGALLPLQSCASGEEKAR